GVGYSRFSLREVPVKMSKLQAPRSAAQLGAGFERHSPFVPPAGRGRGPRSAMSPTLNRYDACPT
ncbi:MAG: hypothetical protein ABI651_14525, partial [Verrucomicrobiota bacterium]